MKNSKEMNRLIKKTIQNHRDQFNPDDIRSFVDIYLKAEMDGEITDSKSGINTDQDKKKNSGYINITHDITYQGRVTTTKKSCKI